MPGDIARQAVDMARVGNCCGGTWRQRTEIEGQPVGQQLKATLAPATLVADAGQGSLARLREQGFELSRRRARACRKQQRQAACYASGSKIARTVDVNFPLPTLLSIVWHQ